MLVVIHFLMKMNSFNLIENPVESTTSLDSPWYFKKTEFLTDEDGIISLLSCKPGFKQYDDN